MAPRPPIDLHYQLEGPSGAPVLVLSHALGLELAMWDPQVPRLSEQLRLLRYDHRGHGSSPVSPGPYTIAELGRDLLRLLDRLELDRVSFCGLSLGGMVGMWIGANEPDRIDRLVLCCTAARMLRPDDFAARARQVRQHGMASIADALVGRWFTPAFAASQPATIARVRSMLLATPVEGYAGGCEAIAQMDVRDDLSRITASSLVIAAAEDQSTPPEQGREIAQRIAGAQLVLIPNASHLANLEQPEAVTLAVRGFIG